MTEKSITVVVRPNAASDVWKGFDEGRQAYVAWVKAPAEDNKANIALIRLIKRELGKGARIMKGKKSRTKTVKLF